jgi:hypothetical protein
LKELSLMKARPPVSAASVSSGSFVARSLKKLRPPARGPKSTNSLRLAETLWSVRIPRASKV